MTNKKLKLAAMSVALTACVAAQPMAAHAVEGPDSVEDNAAPQAEPVVESSTPAPVAEEGEKQEKMLMAAIPFLDQEYQRDLYVVVRLMEMRRMLTGGVLQARSRDTLPPSVRRRQMLSAIRPCLSQGEQTRLDTLMRVMDAREILIQKEGLDGLDKGTNGSAGRGTAAADPGSSGKKQG